MVRLQFSTTNGPISSAVRWFTWSDYSHVDFVLPDGRLLGAQWGGVLVRPHDYQNFSRVAVYGVEAPNSVLTFAYSQIGKPYDYTALLGWLVRRDWKSGGSWFCSELVAAAFESAGTPLLNSGQVNRITPRDLLLSPRLIAVNS